MKTQFLERINSTKSTNKEISEIFKLIKTPNQVIINIRLKINKDINYKDTLEYRRERENNLSAIYWNGHFTNKGGKLYLTQSNKLIYIDIDGFSSIEETIEMKKQIISDWNGCVYACWISVSGLGLGILFKLDKDINEYQYSAIWNFLSNELKTSLNLITDSKTKDITRRNYISYDPELYVDQNCSVISVEDVLKEFPPIEKTEEDEKKLEIVRKKFEEIQSQLLFSTPIKFSTKEVFKRKKISNFVRVNTYWKSENKIKVGTRGKTYTRIVIALLHLNKNKVHIIKQYIRLINKYKTVIPWADSELENFLETTFETLKDKKPITITKTFHLNPIYKQDIKKLEEMKMINMKSIQKKIEYSNITLENKLAINKAISELEVKGQKLTIMNLHRKTGISRSLIYTYYKNENKEFPQLLDINENQFEEWHDKVLGLIEYFRKAQHNEQTETHQFQQESAQISNKTGEVTQTTAERKESKFDTLNEETKQTLRDAKTGKGEMITDVKKWFKKVLE